MTEPVPYLCNCGEVFIHDRGDHCVAVFNPALPELHLPFRLEHLMGNSPVEFPYDMPGPLQDCRKLDARLFATLGVLVGYAFMYGIWKDAA